MGVKVNCDEVQFFIAQIEDITISIIIIIIVIIMKKEEVTSHHS